MEVVAIVALVLAAAVVVSGFVGMFRAFLNRDQVGRDTLGENIEEIHALHELAERRAMLIQLIRSVQLDLESEKISEDEAKLRIAKFERKAVRVAKKMDALVGDDDVRAEAAASIQSHLQAQSGNLSDADWEWSDEALKRHGGSPQTLEADHA